MPMVIRRTILRGEAVSDESEEDTAEGARGESDAVGGERRDQCATVAQGLEEQRSEDQGRSQAVNVEVVVLQSGSYGAGKSCPSQLFRLNYRAVRVSKLCHSTSCRKHSLKNTPDPRWPGEIVSAAMARITIVNRVQHVGRVSSGVIRFIYDPVRLRVQSPAWTVGPVSPWGCLVSGRAP